MWYKITISPDISDWKINNQRLTIHARIKEIVNTLLKNMGQRMQIETECFRKPREFNEAEDEEVEYTGVEPVTSALRTQRSGQLS